MDEDYFVTARPQPLPPEEPVHLTAEQVAELDLSAFHEPFRTPASLRIVMVLGRLLIGLVLLLVAALPVLAVLAFFDLVESLPW